MAGRWQKEEFEELLAHPGLSDAAVAERLPERTPGAVAAVRAGVCYYHRGEDKQAEKFLSHMMLRRLKEGPAVVCAECCFTLLTSTYLDWLPLVFRTKSQGLFCEMARVWGVSRVSEFSSARYGQVSDRDNRGLEG